MARGYKVYRCGKVFHVQVYTERVHPRGLGLEVLAEVPKDRDSYKIWLHETRRLLSSKLYSDGASDSQNELQGGACFSTTEEPRNSLGVDWIFQLDLYHEIFLIDAQPFFNLNNLPLPEIFLDAISIDHYGHRALHPQTPREYWYSWAAPPPHLDLHLFSSFYGRSCQQLRDVSKVLDIQDTLEKAETVNLRLYSTFIGIAMHNPEVGHIVRRLDMAPTVLDWPHSLTSLPLDLINLSVSSFNYMTSPNAIKELELPNKWLSDGVWLRHDTFFMLATHLTDNGHLKSCVTRLVQTVRSNSSRPITVHAILFSLFHCVVVRISHNECKNEDDCLHTEALPFLPTFYA